MHDASPNFETLFTHTKREGWGHAIIAKRGEDRRTYQFEDGELRTIHDDWSELMEPTDHSLDRAAGITRTLRSMLAASGLHDGKATEGRRHDLVTLDEQIAAFRLETPEGFAGAEYRARMRGEGQKRALKRHRDRAVALAQEKLSAGALADRDDRAALAALVAVAKATDLVPSKEVKALAEATAAEGLADALHTVLHGRGELRPRMTAWLAALRETLGARPGWQLATFALALVRPDEHVCVRRTVLVEQARWMAPSLRVDAHPTPRQYVRLRDMAKELATRLAEAGLPPKDLIDVHDFVWATLRPSARASIEQVRDAARAQPAEERGAAEAA